LGVKTELPHEKRDGGRDCSDEKDKRGRIKSANHYYLRRALRKCKETM